MIGLIDDWLFWVPALRLQGWLVYGVAILAFWVVALRLLRRMIGRTLPLWVPAILFLFPCRIALDADTGETVSWLAPALPTLLLSLFGSRPADLLASLEASGLAVSILLPVWLARRFYLRAATDRLPGHRAARSRNRTPAAAPGKD